MSANITTGKFRASFVNVFSPKSTSESDTPKYSITMLIPKTDIATINAINNQIEATIQESTASVFGGVRPAKTNSPLHDGDGARENGEPFGPECCGCYVLTAKANANYPPEVVDINGQAIINHREFYSGCYARASIRFYAYNKNGNKGVGCGLNCIQKLADGEPLASGISAATAFKEPYIEPQGSQAFQPRQYQRYQQPQQYQQYQQYQQHQQPQQYQQSAVNPITGLPMPNSSILGL